MSSDPVTETKETKDAFEEYRDVLLREYKKGNIVYTSIEGPMVSEINHFIRQPIEGILYDLNRLEEVVLTNIKERKWVNDFAVAKTIRKLKEQNDRMLEQLIELYSILRLTNSETVWKPVQTIIEEYAGKSPEDILKEREEKYDR